ncbi:MAG: transketolase family protein [Alphaproteobacteria bacterium]
MRNAFIETLCAEARGNKNIWLLCGDIGYSVLERFQQEFPKRFINVGVAEQNMIGVAAGLAMTGKKVFTYTIGNFSFMRCLEQIRNDVCYHNLDVKVVALGGGFAYGGLGYTHHVIEDIAMMRTLPNIRVVAPGDPAETIAATQALCASSGPTYLRLGRGGEPTVHKTPPAFSFDKALVLSHGRDVTIVTTAGTLDIVSQAAETLQASGMSVGVISVPVLQPFDARTLVNAVRNTTAIITIEEHGMAGLGTLVAECLVEHQLMVPLRRLFIQTPPQPQVGNKEWLRALHGITAQSLVNTAKSLKS